MTRRIYVTVSGWYDPDLDNYTREDQERAENPLEVDQRIAKDIDAAEVLSWCDPESVEVVLGYVDPTQE